MIQIGDYVSRNSYHNDMIFKVINIKNDILYLKGIEYRLYADAKISDCLLEDKKKLIDDFSPTLIKDDDVRGEYFYLPGKILHIDSDREYLKRCMKYYKNNNLYAIGKCIDESELIDNIYNLLEEYKPDILVITGHDYLKKNTNKNDINCYQNSKNFYNAVKEARRYEKSHDKLIVVAGACQSDYEDLIKAGANFASSPKRINIHALDPAIIASNLSMTKKNKEIDLKELLSKTKNGSDGIGGLMCSGMMYVGYPR